MSGQSRPIRMLIADDQYLFLTGLANVLRDWPDVQVVGQASNGREAVKRVRQLRPDVVLMDINMPEMTGLEATRIIRREMPEVKVVMLTVSEEDEYLFEAIKLGAHGYLLKDLKPVVLREMIAAVSRGETPISPLMAKKVLREFARHIPATPIPGPVEELTDREKDVLALAAGGADNRAIAEQLYLAPGTVKRHMHNILTKLHARSRAEAAAYAIREGIIPPQAPE
jgi:two-component system, NarL family, nitrate/nitrite response regulator NarL